MVLFEDFPDNVPIETREKTHRGHKIPIYLGIHKPTLNCFFSRRLMNHEDDFKTIRGENDPSRFLDPRIRSSRGLDSSWLARMTGPESPPFARARAESNRRLDHCLVGPWQEKHFSARSGRIWVSNASLFWAIGLWPTATEAGNKTKASTNRCESSEPHRSRAGDRIPMRKACGERC